MRNWPVTDAFWVTLLGIALLWPMLRLSGGQSPQVLPDDRSDAASIPTFVTIRSAHPPQSLEIRHEGEVLYQAAPAEPFIEADWELPVEATGLELAVRASWPPGTPETVVEVTLEPDGLDSRSASAWGAGELDSILQFPWP